MSHAKCLNFCGQEVETRTYPATAWVSTKVKAMRHKEGATEGFWKLFNYIQGKNEKSEFS